MENSSSTNTMENNINNINTMDSNILDTATPVAVMERKVDTVWFAAVVKRITLDSGIICDAI